MDYNSSVNEYQWSVLLSTDNGQTFTSKASFYEASSTGETWGRQIFFSQDQSTIYSVGSLNGQLAVFISNDTGSTWTKIDAFKLQGASFSFGTSGVSLSDGTLFVAGPSRFPTETGDENGPFTWIVRKYSF